MKEGGARISDIYNDIYVLNLQYDGAYLGTTIVVGYKDLSDAVEEAIKDFTDEHTDMQRDKFTTEPIKLEGLNVLLSKDIVDRLSMKFR